MTNNNSSGNEQWINYWALMCGIMLTVGSLLPYLRPRTSSIKAYWPWDLWERFPWNLTILAIMLTLTMLVPLILRASVKPKHLAPALLAFIVIMMLASNPTQNMTTALAKMFGRRYTTAGVISAGVILLIVSTVVMAASAHLSRTYKDWDAPYYWMRMASIVFLICIILLFLTARSKHGSMVVEKLFFKARSWEKGWAILITILIFFSYSIMCLVHSITRSLHDALYTMLRVILIGVPILLFIGFMSQLRNIKLNYVFAFSVGFIKTFCLIYGTYILMGASLCATVKQYRGV